MNKNTKKTICDKNFDVEGFTITRVIKQGFLTRLFPTGNNISGNIRIRDAAHLFIEHRFGEKIAYLTTKYERQVHQIQNIRWRIINKIKRILGKA